MEREDAVRKVVACMRLVNDDGATEGEREAAQAQATKLRLIHGISDADLKRSIDISEAASGPLFGMFSNLFFYSDSIKPYLDRIADEMDKAMARADQAPPIQRLEAYCKFYLEARALLESSYMHTYYRRNGPSFTVLQERRNQVVKDYYLAECEDERQRNREFNAQFPQYSNDEISESRAHDRALFSTALHSDLRKDTVENIVGIHAEDFQKADWKEGLLEDAKKHGCTCTPSFKDVPLVKKGGFGKPDIKTRRTWPHIIHQEGCEVRPSMMANGFEERSG